MDDYELQLAEIEVYSGSEEVPLNYAEGAPAETNGTLYAAGWQSMVALTDGNHGTMLHGDGAGGVTGFAEEDGFYYQVDLGQTIDIANISVWPRQDGCCPDRLTNYRVSVHEDNGGMIGQDVWSADYRTDFSYPDAGPVDPDLMVAEDDPAGVFSGQWVRITSLESPISDYALQIAEIEVFGTTSGGIAGDFDGSGTLDAADIDLLSAAVRNLSTDLTYDLNDDAQVNDEDRTVWVEGLKRTYFGDADLDGAFTSTDFVAVFQTGEYEDGVAMNSGWATGDWDGDSEFDSSDFVKAFQSGGYEAGPRQGVAAVPEPASVALLGCGLLAVCPLVRRRKLA